MIISPPFLPANGMESSDPARIDPMMDVVDKLELPHHGVYPIAFDRRWHCGAHLQPSLQNEAVRAIADGEVVAYRVSQKAIGDGQKKNDGSDALNSNTGFVLLKHTTETGDGRTITFYSLYMHLLDLESTRTNIKPLPANPPAVGSSTVLPKWLCYPSDGVKVPQNLKVYRKDMLGYPGACHGQSHLHFEIFMTEVDFGAWFEQAGHTVQLGNAAPTTPASKDYWGHSYFVITGPQAFVSTPNAVGAAAEYFPALQAGTLDAGNKLYVEAYFHKGQRYTRSWLEKVDTITLLTPAPERDAYADYEYKMYARATALYPSCPSDGYEMLRFGRILSKDLTPPAAPPKTWVAVTFDAGKQGYVDISQSTIQKLSDANFPFFTGWQKIDEGNALFSQDGLCDQDALRNIVKVVEDLETPTERLRPEWGQEDKLAAYIQTHAEVREKLKGFICHAPSEWDASGNEERYKRLNDPNGFFGKRKETDPNGYNNFLKFQKQLQFLDKTPLDSGQKFWFFHPLAFVRHFRKCGWLARNELLQLLPAFTFDKNGANWLWSNISLNGAASLLSNDCSDAISRRLELNAALRKYGITPLVRMACFFGNATQETQWFQKYHEGSPYWYRPWDGRGFLQLTHAANYIKYWTFRGLTTNEQSKLILQQHTTQANNNRPVINGKRTMFDPANSLSDTSTHISAEIINRRNDTKNAFEAADSAGSYWAWSNAASGADEYYSTPNGTLKVLNTNSGPRHYYENRAFGKVAGTVNTGSPSSSYSAIWGIQARFLAFGNAQVVLLDAPAFNQIDGSFSQIPVDYVRREIP
ncbi:M23 family metallopeptidase [Cupriavidus sp. P-10]|uniref:hypothetical protein n=1 Tax=Cupriavidus sp. P-10 TaxID=2027911 RepID=UPI0021888060|nr:hypothetical protein [Cupriavidus sp. P-10]BDB27455.1 M23 family metallopeptidase [Cupriavidus sp. P-10]